MGVARRAAPAADAPAAADYAPDDTTPEGFTPEDENEETTRSSSVPRRGWGVAKQTVSRASSFESEFKLSDKESLIKFVEDEPFVSVLIHWVDEITEGQRSFYCLEDGCPLCGIGYKRTPQVWFNVVPLTIDGGAAQPEMMVLKAGAKLTDLIRSENEGRGGPLSRHFWKISKSGGGKGKGAPNFSLAVVKGRDLVEDWELDPEVVAASLTSLKPYTDKVVNYPTRARLEQVIDEHLS
jgi:hypothetical protein